MTTVTLNERQALRGTRRRRAAAAAVQGALALVLLPGCAARLASFHRGAPAPRAAHAPAATVAVASTSDSPAPEAAGPLGPYRLAERAMAADSSSLAEFELREALSRDAAYAPAITLLSKLLYQGGRHREAIDLLRPLLDRGDALDAETRQALLGELALHEDAVGRTDEARAAIASARAAGAGPASPEVYVVLRGDAPDSATALAKDALHHDGRSAVNLNNFGITRLRAGRPDEARRAFLDAIDRDASLPGPYYNLAILDKFYRFDDTSAVRWFAEYWSRSHADPDSLRAVFAPGLAHASTGGKP